MKPMMRILVIAIAVVCNFSREATSQVRFGSTLSLSGSTANYGENARDGMELAREEINSNGGVRGEKLEIVYEDIGDIDLKRAASAAHKLISLDKVSAILPMVTEDAQVVHPIAESSGVITMAVFAGGRDLTRGKRLLYQVSSADEALMRRLADHVASLKIKRGCILAEQGAYALPLANYAKEYLSLDKQISVTISDTRPIRPIFEPRSQSFAL